MEFKYRAVDDRSSPLSSSVSTMNCFTEQAMRAGYSNNGTFLNEVPSNPSDMREDIQRELEKERIREEIIAREIARRRILEAEVRRELMIEQEMMLNKNEGKSPASLAMRFDRYPLFYQSDSRALEERLNRSLEQRLALEARQEMLSALETGTSFQRVVNAVGPEVMPSPEFNKDRVILLPKPENLSGVKRKAMAPSTVVVNEDTSDGSKKKLKEEWSCALCQVSATSERALHEHLRGKKHKAKAAGLVPQRVGRKSAHSHLQKKFSKASEQAETTDAPGAQEMEKIIGEAIQADIVGEASASALNNCKALDEEKKNDELLPQKNKVGKDMKKNGDATKPKGQTPVDPKLRKFKFWCELCHVGAYVEAVMSGHKRGKKHMARVRGLSQHGIVIPVSSTTISPPEVIQHAETEDVIAVEADENQSKIIESNDVGSGPSPV